MRLPALLFIMILGGGLPVLQAVAEPAVILDAGGESTEPYLRVFHPVSVPDFGALWVQEFSPRIQQNPSDPSIWLPLTTRKMRPGRMKREREVYYTDLDAPICVVGSDPLSLRWISKHLEGLTFIKARCWLVQAHDFGDFQRVAEALRGQVMLLPADGDAVADFFELDRYPVIIDERYIGQ